MSKSLPSATLLAAIVLLAGCRTPAVPIGTGHLIEPDDALRLGYTLGPAIDLGLAPEDCIDHTVVLDDLLIVVASPSNLVMAVSLHDGSILWETTVSSPHHQLFRPTRWEDKILINSETRLYALSAATGQRLHDQALEAPVNHGPGMADSLAIFGGINGRIFAFDARTSSVRWRRDMTGVVLASPAVYRDSVFVSDSNGVGRMLDTASGNTLWRTRTFGRVVASPAIRRVGLYIASEDQSLYAMNRIDGVDRWLPYRTEKPLRETPVLIEDLVFITVPDQGLDVLDDSSGERLWRFGSEAQPVAMVKGRVLLNDGDDLFLVDPQNGKVFKQVPVLRLQAVIRLKGDRLVLFSPDGRILRLDPTGSGS